MKYLSKEDAKKIGEMLGYIDEIAEKRGRRFYSYLKGEIKNWDYNETVHFGDIKKKIVPIIDFLRNNDYKF